MERWASRSHKSLGELSNLNRMFLFNLLEVREDTSAPIGLAGQPTAQQTDRLGDREVSLSTSSGGRGVRKEARKERGYRWEEGGGSEGGRGDERMR